MTVLVGLLVCAFVTYQAGKPDPDGSSNQGRGIIVGLVSILIVGALFMGDPMGLVGSGEVSR